MVFLAIQTEDLKTKKREREELGVQLYGVQQELARQQMLLEKEHDNFNSENHLRMQSEKLLEETRALHDKTTEDLKLQRKQGTHGCTKIVTDKVLLEATLILQIQLT